jgi:choline dehydrogenase
VEGIEFGRKVVNSVPVPIGPFNETSPCPGNVRCDTKAYILKRTWPHHATSTCAIGADNDPLAVLDSNFRVWGTKGLRVVDGSTFPRPPGAFPVLPTFMLSLKARMQFWRIVAVGRQDCGSLSSTSFLHFWILRAQQI